MAIVASILVAAQRMRQVIADFDAGPKSSPVVASFVALTGNLGASSDPACPLFNRIAQKPSKITQPTRNQTVLATETNGRKSYVFGQATDGPLRGSLTHPCFLDDLSP